MKNGVVLLLVIILGVGLFFGFPVQAREQKDYNIQGGMASAQIHEVLEKIAANGENTIALLEEIRDLLKQQNEVIFEK